MRLSDFYQYVSTATDSVTAKKRVEAAKVLMESANLAPVQPTLPDPTPTPTPNPVPIPVPQPTPTGLQMGVAISGLEFAETVLPGVANQTYPIYAASEYSAAAQKGFKAIRLPFVSDRLFVGNSSDYEPNYKKYIDDAIAASPVPVWLDPHNYGRRSGKTAPLGTPNYPVSLFVERLTRLATTYKDNPKVACIELDNEPHGLSSVSFWYNACEMAVTSMSIGGWTKLIGVPVYHWSSMDDFFNVHGGNFTAPITGDKIRYVFHNYFNAGNTGYQHPTAPNESSQTHVDRLNAVIQWAKSQNVRLAVTEFGVPATSSWVANMKPFVDTMKADSTVTHAFYWASGSWYASETVLRDIHLPVII